MIIPVMIELQILGLIGLLIHYLKVWVNLNKDGETYNLKKAIPTAVLSGITTALLIYLKDDIEDLYPITRFSAIVLGYMGNSVFFSFIDAKKPNVIDREN